MKKALSLLLLSLVFLCNLGFALENRVFDEANLLTEMEQSTLQAQIETLYKNNQLDLVVVTTNNNKTSARRYADDFYEQGGFGVGPDHSGALILIDMENRELYISTEGEMIDILNDDRIESLLDVFFDFANKGTLFQAITACLIRLDSYIQQGPVWNQHRYQEIDPFSPSWLLLSLGTGLVVSGIACLVIRANYKKNFKPVAYDYKTNSRLSLAVQNDTLIDSRVTKQYIPPASTGGGGGGGSGRSTTHTSSSGRTHGGGGRKF